MTFSQSQRFGHRHQTECQTSAKCCPLDAASKNLPNLDFNAKRNE